MASRTSSLVARAMAPAWLCSCLLLGGSGSAGIVANTLLQIAAGTIVLVLIYRSIPDLTRPARLLLGIVGVAATLTLLSLVPLPPALWSLLPGRAPVLGAYALLGMPAPWLPVSLTPDATIASVLRLLVPVAMFLLVQAAPPEGRRATVVTLVVVAFVSVLFGVTQQIAGFNSDAYIYDITSRGGAVGFFANRNHLATLCLTTIPFLAAFVALTLGRGSGRRDGTKGRWLAPLAALLLMVVGTLLVQSRAGLILLFPTALAGFLLVWRHRQGRLSHRLLGIAAAVVAVAIILVVFAPPMNFAELGGEANPRERRAIMEVTWQAIGHYFPVGTGAGSFVRVYPLFENEATVSSTYINHAHNDYLEILLETGLAGGLLVAAFLMWWGDRLLAAWRSGGDVFARAATVSIGVVLAHSIVDFPARTAAIACVLALCCGLACTATQVAVPPRRGRERSTGTIMLGESAAPSRRGGTPASPQA